MQEKTILIPVGDAFVYYKVPENPPTLLPKGVYKVESDMRQTYYKTVKLDNDPPIDIGRMPSKICNEIATFFQKKEVFKKYGFAHKRGILFYGQPGNGKTSLLRLIEERFINQFDGIVLIWDGDTQMSKIVNHFRTWEPDRPLMVVAEDIDGQMAAFESDLLELLDGQSALNNFVLIATTNFLESVPDRIKNRPSRIDRLVEVPPPPPDARKQYLLKIGLEEEISDKIVSVSEGFSMAALKEVALATLCFGETVEEVVERLRNQDFACSKPQNNFSKTVKSAMKLGKSLWSEDDP